MQQIATFEANTQKSINALKSEVTKLKQQSTTCEKKIEDQKQFELLNGLVISGINEEFDTDSLHDVVANVINSKMHNVSLTPNEINYCYRLCKKEDRQSTKPRPVVIMFVNKWKRNMIFNLKKCLKGSRMVISEWLTSAKLELYKKACDKFGFKSTWSRNGQIFASINNVKRRILSESDLSIDGN